MVVAKIAIIWMHGLGDKGSSWRDLEEAIDLRVPSKWAFPDAPYAAVTCNGGHESTSWFDIERIPVIPNCKDYPADIEKSVIRIHGMIADLEKQGYASHEIFVGGFSQGGAMALQSALRYPKMLGGAVCMSGWLMMAGSIETWSTPEGRKTPLFWGHGTSDNVVAFNVQAPGIAVLEKLGCKVRMEAYPGVAHSMGSNTVDHFAQFFNARAEREL